jgi:hypothetical protein
VRIGFSAGSVRTTLENLTSERLQTCPFAEGREPSCWRRKSVLIQDAHHDFHAFVEARPCGRLVFL